MQTVTFIKAFTIREDAATTTTYPEGWVGEVTDDLAAAAAEEGCIKVAADAEPEPQPEPEPKGKAAKAPAADADAPPA